MRREGHEGKVATVVENEGRIIPRGKGGDAVLLELDGAGVEVDGGGREEREL